MIAALMKKIFWETSVDALVPVERSEARSVDIQSSQSHQEALDILALTEKKEAIKKQIIAEISERYGQDVSKVFHYAHAWERFPEISQYLQDLQSFSTQFISTFLQGIISSYTDNKISFRTLDRIESDIRTRFFLDNKWFFNQQKFPSIYSFLLKEYSTLIEKLNYKSQDLWFFISESLGEFLISLDDRYIYDANFIKNQEYANLSGDTLDIILLQQISKNDDFFKWVSTEEIERGIKILFLQQLIHDIFWNTNKKLIYKDTKNIFVLFLYLQNLLEEDKKSKDSSFLEKRRMFQSLLEVRISKKQSDDFFNSKLYIEYIQVYQFSPSFSQFLAKLFFMNPLFFSWEELHMGFIQILHTVAQGKEKQESILKYLSQNPSNSNLEIEHIRMVILLWMETLDYIKQIQSRDIEWIFYYFTERPKEWSSNYDIVFAYDMGILWDINYFILQQLQKETDENIHFILETREKCTSILPEIMMLWYIKNLIAFLPDSIGTVWEIKEYVNSYRYLGDTQKLQGLYFDIQKNILFQDIATFHCQELKLNAEQIKAIEIFYSWFYNRERCQKIFSFLRDFFGLSEFYQEKISESFWALSPEKIFILISRIWESLCWFCDFTQNYADWDDIETSLTLFLEISSSNKQEQYNSWDQEENIWVSLFWEEDASFLEKLELSQKSQDAILELCLSLNDYFLQTFFNFLRNKTLLIWEMDRQWILADQVKQSYKIITFFHSLGIWNIQKPEKIFEFLIGWSHTIESIHTMIQTLQSEFRDESEIASKYDDFIGRVMKYLRTGDMNILRLSQTSSESIQEIERKVESAVVKTRNTRTASKSPVHLVFENEKSSKIYRTLFSQEYTPVIFLLTVKEILTDTFLYSSKVYVYMMKILEERNIVLEEWLQKILCEKFWRSQGYLYPQDISELVLALPNGYFWESVTYIFRALVKKVHFCKESYTSRQIADIFYGLQHFWNSPFAIDFLKEFRKKFWKNYLQKLWFTPTEVYKSLYGLMFYEKVEWIPELQDSFFSLVPSFQDFDRVDAVTLTQLYSLYNREIPEKLRKSWHSYRKKAHFSSSRSEDIIYAQVYEKYPDAEQGKYIDGFECDIFIPSLKINIEIDGPYHVGAKAKRDALRDKYLKEKHGITVRRISLQGNKVFEVLRQSIPEL